MIDTLDSAARVMYAFCCYVGIMRLFSSIKKTNVHTFAAKVNGSFPLIEISSNSKNSRLVVSLRSFQILLVDTIRHLPKIDYAVVISDAIYVVNLKFRKFTIYIQPCKSMGRVAHFVYHNNSISPSRDISSNTANYRPSSRHVSSPLKLPTLLVIVQKFKKGFFRQATILFSHDTVLSLIGQKPACADNTRGLRYFKSRVGWCTE